MVMRKLIKRKFLLLLSVTGLLKIFEVAYFSKSKWEDKTCGCENCLSDHHHWFMQRFHKNITLFLSRGYNLSEEDFTWWTNLYCRKCNITSFRELKERVFEFFPGAPAVAEADPERCRTCAVVGNSVNLKRSHYGKLIDFHDFVFRINRGRSRGFEEDVGNRTTHRVMYPESATSLDKNTHMVFFPFKMTDFQWLLRSTKDVNRTEWSRDIWMKKPVKANKNLVMVANPAFMKYVHHTWLQKKGYYPSTGFLTVVLALHMCDQVSVFGFGADSDGNWSHYWEVLRWKTLKTGAHPGSVEYDTIAELGKRGKVTFYTGL